MIVNARFGGSRVLGMLVLMGALGACRNMFVGTITPVPPVHRLAATLEGAVVLVDKDPIIETRDPNHVLRANEQNVPHDYRAAMERALVLGGFRVTNDPAERHDLVARLAIAVREEGETVHQVYRCGLSDAGGAPVAQVDWPWPKGVYVDPVEVYDFATHNVVTDLVSSPAVIRYLQRARAGTAARPASPP